MIEVFVAFHGGHNLQDLEKTLEAWNQPGMEPIAVEVKPKKFELHRRVTAENLSHAHYVMASVGCGPVEENFADLALEALAKNPKAGLITPASVGPDWVSGRVAVCRKGVITHWIIPQGSQEADVIYASAHAAAYHHAGYEGISCQTLHYRLLAESSPC